MKEINYIEEFKNYQVTMTEEERMQKYFAGERVDHIPFQIEEFDMPFWNNQGYTTYDVNHNFDLFVDLQKKKFEEYDINGLALGYGLQNFGEALGSELTEPKNGVSRITRYAMAAGIDLSNFEVPTTSNNHYIKDVFEEMKKLKEIFPDQGITPFSVGPVSLATELRPIEMFLRDLRKEPENVKNLLEFVTKSSLTFMEEFTREFGKYEAFIPDPISSSDLLSKDQFEKYSFPYLNELIDGINEITGYKPTLHICGHTKKFWPYLYELNISSFSVDNCEDIGETKEFFGDKFVVIGNIPPTEVMRFGSPEDVIEAVKECIKKAADSPNGYILNLGCDMPIGTSEENIAAFFYAARKYGANAKMGEIPEAVYQD